MHNKAKIITLFITGALVMVTAFGVLGYQSVYAQTTTPTPTVPNSQTPPNAGDRMGGPRFGLSDQDLAAALGITTDQLQAAYKTANAEALKQAVSKGLITQAQADKASANDSNGRHFGLPGMLGGTNGIDYNAILANALGITTDKLQAANQQAYNTSLDNAVKNGSMTQQQADEIKGRAALAKDTVFQSAIKSAYEAAIKVAVSSNVITQAQADAILKSLTDTGSFAPDRMGHGFNPGFKGGPGGFGGQRPKDGQGNIPGATATPATN
jgi:hypothetical protein